MGYDDNSYVHSSHTSIHEAYSHGANVTSRASARIARSSGLGHHPVLPKAEDDDGDGSTDLDRRLHGPRVTSETPEGRELRRRRDARRAKKEDIVLTFAGLSAAERSSPRYQQYRKRARQKSKDKPGKDDVWPDHLENAFQLALRVIPPMGRRQIWMDGKACGRNELLTKKILAWTGETRKRKQISSHIQVLKNLMPDIHEWLKHATLIKDSSSTAAKASILDNIDTRELNMEDGEMALYARSYYGDPGQWACSNALSLPPPHGILGSNAPGRGPFVNRIEFEMYVQSPDKESIHSYTSNQTEIGAPSRALEDVSNWRSSYPLLEEYYENGQLDSEIILIESNLNVLGEYPPIGSTLSIDFRVNIAGLAGQKQWSLKSEYYENQGQLVDMRTFYARHNIRKSFPWDTPNIFQGAAGSDVALEIPLHSPWWVQLFTKMATRKRETKHDPYLSQQEDEWSRRYLEDMSIMQELWVDRGIDGSPGSRVAIILWQFSQAHGAAGTTTWRKLKSPPARIQINSPSQLHPPPLAHSVVLDSALQSLAMPQAISVNTERFLHNVDLFTDGIERIDTQSQSARGSESPALSPDYTTSFPSSTSTSFPPSITHGYLSHEDSQESACFSQESDVSRKGSLDAQYPFAYSQKSAYSYQEPRTYGDDLRYLSDNHAFDTQDPAYYSQQSFDSIPHYHAEAHYDSLDGEPPHDSSFAGPDFTGGKIQLSFQQHDVLANTQVVPALGMAHVGHAPEAQDHAVVQALHPTIQGFLAVVADTAAVGHVHHEDFDFSTLESHFTPEEIAALRMQDPEHHQPGGLGALLHDRSVVPNFNHLHASFHGSGEHLIMDTLNHVDDDALVRMEHGVVLREVSGKEIEGAVREVNEEELASDEVNGEESQVVEGQGQRIDGGPEDGYDDDDDGLHEDAL